MEVSKYVWMYGCMGVCTNDCRIYVAVSVTRSIFDGAEKEERGRGCTTTMVVLVR